MPTPAAAKGGIQGVEKEFQKAIAGSSDYTEQFADLLGAGTSVEDSYWEMVTTDITDALEVELAFVHQLAFPIGEDADGGVFAIGESGEDIGVSPAGLLHILRFTEPSDDGDEIARSHGVARVDAQVVVVPVVSVVDVDPVSVVVVVSAAAATCRSVAPSWMVTLAVRRSVLTKGRSGGRSSGAKK